MNNYLNKLNKDVRSELYKYLNEVIESNGDSASDFPEIAVRDSTDESSVTETYKQFLSSTYGSDSDALYKYFTGTIIHKDSNETQTYYDFKIVSGKNTYLCKAEDKTVLEELAEGNVEIFAYGRRIGKRLLLIDTMGPVDYKYIFERFGKQKYFIFTQISESVRVDILDQLGIRKKPLNSRVDFRRSMGALKNKYDFCKDTYDEKTKERIETLLHQISSDKSSDNSRKAKRMESLQYLLGINTSYFPDEITEEGMLESLNKELYGLSAVKEEVAIEMAVQARSKSHKGLSMLIISRPGMGKSAFALAVAMARNKPYAVVNCCRVDTACALIGVERFFDSSAAGLIMTSASECATIDSSFILDEIDKSSHENGRNGNPDSVYANILDGFCEDKFIDGVIDLSKAMIIATANDESKIPEYVKNRFDIVIHLDDYTLEDKLQIAYNYVLPKLFDEFNVPENTISFDEEAVKYIITDFCLDNGMRDLSNNLKRIVKKSLSAIEKDGSINITKAIVKKMLSTFSSSALTVKKNISFFKTEADKNAVYEWIELLNDNDEEKRKAAQRRLDELAEFFNNTIDVSSLSIDMQKFNSHLNKTHSELEDAKKHLSRSFNNFSRTKKKGKICYSSVFREPAKQH